jgi:diketogulonate reductase-like aldo/keto reductase
MKTVELPSGERVPALGLGTWHMAERAVARGEEIAALQHGIDQGASLIDTAEMYADGGAERLQAAGKIRHWGVSNLDGADVQELLGAPAGDRCSVNQVLYNLSARGIEWGLEPLCRRRGIPRRPRPPVRAADRPRTARDAVTWHATRVSGHGRDALYFGPWCEKCLSGCCPFS